MKKVFIYLSISILLVSCKSTCNKIHRDGSVIGTTAGDWIVVKYNGGVITDVWKMRGVLVQSEENSDGWLFDDNNGNIVNLSGDTKAIRVRQSDKEALYNSYVEYHMEYDSVSYWERRSQTLKK